MALSRLYSCENWLGGVKELEFVFVCAWVQSACFVLPACISGPAGLQGALGESGGEVDGRNLFFFICCLLDIELSDNFLYKINYSSGQTLKFLFLKKSLKRWSSCLIFSNLHIPLYLWGFFVFKNLTQIYAFCTMGGTT